MKGRLALTIGLAVATAAVLVASLPASLREAWRRGGLYLFSHDFFADLPARLAGPGRLRFFVQPLIASLLGIRAGRADRAAGRPPFLFGLFFRGERTERLRSGYQDVVNLVLVGILLDSLFQWTLLGTSYPGAALVVGPILVSVPYVLARALSNRFGAQRGAGAQGSH